MELRGYETQLRAVRLNVSQEKGRLQLPASNLDTSWEEEEIHRSQ
jgi:hypothetical protein